MRSRADEKITQNRKQLRAARFDVLKKNESDKEGKNEGKQNRVGKAAVSPEVTVRNAKSKCNDIQGPGELNIKSPGSKFVRVDFEMKKILKK